MPVAKNTVLRDNTRDNRLIQIPGNIAEIINCPAFQRLRHIRQTGLAHYVFPTAEHTRFAHSVGVYATANDVFEALRRKAEPLDLEFPPFKFDNKAEAAFCVAALCHDIGHTAYSHALEGTLLPYGYRSHEQCSLYLLHNDRDVRAAIGKFADIDEVILFLDKNHPNRALNSLISGSFDVDRCDYLQRDNLECGVQYGAYDYQWLLHSFTVRRNEIGQPILVLNGPRGLDALRQFLGARRNMYKHVYYHHAIRSAQLLLQSIFIRLLEVELTNDEISTIPQGLRRLANGSELTIGDFLSTTDIEVQYLVRSMSEVARDPVLRELCRRFVARDLPKCVIDSSKLHAARERAYRLIWLSEAQLGLWGNPTSLAELLSAFRDEIAPSLVEYVGAAKEARELANYLIFPDESLFPSDPPLDLRLDFEGEERSVSDLLSGSDAELVADFTEVFLLRRLFAPEKYRKRLQNLLDDLT